MTNNKRDVEGTLHRHREFVYDSTTTLTRSLLIIPTKMYHNSHPLVHLPVKTQL